MATTLSRPRIKRSLDLLSSMPFAIAMLSVLSLASVIGTLLKQNEPLSNYLNQFGPFWFPVFKWLGLYSVYNSPWFLAILSFLLLSTSLCIIRHAKPMWHDMRSYRENAREISLRLFQHHAEQKFDASGEALQARAQTYLQAQGFRLRQSRRPDASLLAARTGGSSRLGYFLTHGAIIVICVGGLLDGNVPLKIGMWLGAKSPMNAQISEVAAVPAAHRLSSSNPSFRGNMFIPEGKSASVAVLNLEDGMLLQDLPFAVSLKKFHIDHYATGQPKRFASDIIITDLATGQSTEHTIEVNKPYKAQGITLYQSSFEDGGSRLALRMHPLAPDQGLAQDMQGVVGESSPLNTAEGNFTLEFSEFRPFNIVPAPETEAPLKGMAAFQKHLGSAAKPADERLMQNLGPSFTYRLRNASGQAREYINYMSPSTQDGQSFLLAGMREDLAAPFRFLRLPLDPQGKSDGWFALRKLLLDPAQRAALSQAYAASANRQQTLSPATVERLAQTAERTLALFADKGFDSLGAFIQKTVPADEQDNVSAGLLRVLEGIAWEAWLQVRSGTAKPDESLDSRFTRAALESISDSLHYGSPVFLELKGFDQVQATVLQATRSPGEPLVFLGSLLLVLGVFAMLYIRERRLFVLIKDSGEVLMALSANRQGLELEKDFTRHRDALFAALAPPASITKQ